MIYLKLEGRIGNQLFQFAYAEAIRQKRGRNEIIVVDDYEVCKLDWIDSLHDYNIPNVEFVSEKNALAKRFPLKYAGLRLFQHMEKNKSYMQKFEMEKRAQPVLNDLGIVRCENGFLEGINLNAKNIVLSGFFQSEKYFAEAKKHIVKDFELKNGRRLAEYPNIDKIRERNSVCISAKVQHNVGNPLYDVCNDGYWKKAIELIGEKVENPLFFICSDDVDYVMNNLIDCDKYDVICQSGDFSVSESLAAMAMCKNFIIGNTTYGWWAQYLSDYSKKIVAAPSKWMRVEMPIDIYQDGWHLIEV